MAAGTRAAPAARTGASLARRLSIELVAIAALSSVLLYLAVRASSGEAAGSAHDGILAASAEAIAERLGGDADGVFVDIPYGALAMLGAVSDDRVFYRVLDASRTLTGYDGLAAPERAAAPAETLFYTTEYRGTPVRVAALSRRVAVAGRSHPVQVLVGQTLDGETAIASRAARRAALLGVLSFALAAALGAFSINRALTPLRRVASDVRRRGPADLQPLDAPLPRELVPLGAALDGFMARLDAALERTETFIGEAAHHVRTPLAVVRARAEGALRRSDDAVLRDDLRGIIRAVDESARSADQLLDHAMVAQRAERVARERLDVAELLGAVVRGYAPLAEHRDVELVAELEPGLVVAGDRVQLEAALGNLVDNALKYSFADSRIDASARRDGARALIAVRDRGRGLGDAAPVSLTARYRRGPNVADVVGSGLGLAIVEQVALAHGGTVSVRPADGGGTLATLRLPLA